MAPIGPIRLRGPIYDDPRFSAGACMKSHKVKGAIRYLPESLSVLIVFAVLTTAAYAQAATQPERLKHTLAGHSGPVRAVAFSPVSQTLVSVDWDCGTCAIPGRLVERIGKRGRACSLLLTPTRI